MNYVPRREWDTVAPTNATPWKIDRLDGGGIHWFAIPNGPNDHSQCDDTLRGVRAAHKNGEFNDIAYNHAVCQHGYVYELRGFDHQSGANGYSDVNRSYYSVVCMLGVGDSVLEFTPAMQQALREIIAEWQRRGAGTAVLWHGFWTGSTCPGDTVRAWVKAGLWKLPEPTPDPKEPDMDAILEWLDDFISWRLVDMGDPAKRPANVPAVIPPIAWEFTALCKKISDHLGMAAGEEEWIRFRLVGGERPQVPTLIPKPWWDDAQKVHQIATAYAEKA
jgi:hypothetical protein